MTDQEINVAIAEALGKRYHKPTEAEIASGSYYQFEPSYTTDLNAMHEAERTLTGQQCLQYAIELNKATKCFEHITPIIMCMATARQRAEAFCRVKGLWKE